MDWGLLALLGGCVWPILQRVVWGFRPIKGFVMHESESSAALSPGQKTAAYPAGTVVRVTQQIPHRLDTCTASVTGRVVRQERHGSGSWYARNKDNRLWLDRLVLEKADGEITILNLDEYSVVEVLEGAVSRDTVPLVDPAESPAAGIT
jgi:hypothetical protein